MSEKEKLIEYQEGDLTVEWRPERCIHSKVCVKGLPKVFRPKEKPWIQIKNAENEAIIKQVKKCPSGALKYRISGEKKEQNMSESKQAQVKVMENGPLLFEGTCEITLANGKTETK